MEEFKKSFGSLSTIEVAQLNETEINRYISEGDDREFILKEISDCKKRLDSLGIVY